jgi:hypothetical protein
MRALLVLFLAALPAQAADADLTPLQPPAIYVERCPMPAFEQPSRLAVWQYYAVDRSGHFRPRVPLNPAPFNPATIQPRIFMPYILN